MKNKEKLLDDMLVRQRFMLLQNHDNTYSVIISVGDFSYKDDKKNLAKCLSGFSNSSGGVIVWGVETNKNENSIDCASGFKEIAPLSLFVSRLNELTGESISPISDGIIHKMISLENDSGFAISYVPESEVGPHMAKLGVDIGLKT